MKTLCALALLLLAGIALGGITGTNDFQGVTGDNAMDKFFQYGTSGG